MPFLDELTACLGQHVHVTEVVNNIEAGTQLYVCGPRRMLDAVRRAWHRCNLPMVDLRYESFATSGQFAATEFQVSIPRLGKKVTVDEHDDEMAMAEDGHMHGHDGRWFRLWGVLLTESLFQYNRVKYSGVSCS